MPRQDSRDFYVHAASNNFFFFSKYGRKEDILKLNQSLRILSNLVAADAVAHTSRDEIIFELLGLTSALISQKKIDFFDLIAKVCLLVMKRLMCNCAWLDNNKITLSVGYEPIEIKAYSVLK